MQQYRFKKAILEAKRGLAECETKPGREAFKVLIERYERLQKLKEFLVNQLNTNPVPWIWGSGASAEDVKEASEYEIRLQKESVKWEAVSVAQFLKFINAYTKHRDVRLRQQCTQLLAAAIFCQEFGSEKAKEAAHTFSNRAVAICDDLKDEVQRLLEGERFF